MKKWSKEWKHKFWDYWQSLYHSTVRKLSKGSQQIRKMLTVARGENWRRPRK